MRYLIVMLFVLSTACADDPDPYTWGDVSEELASTYCEGADACTFEVDVDLCTEHTAWHLCEADRSCDAEVDADVALDALEVCRAAVEAGAAAFAEPGGDADVCNGILFGYLPPECNPVFDLKPE